MSVKGIKQFFFDFSELCKKAEVPAKFLIKLSCSVFLGLTAAGITIMFFPSIAEPSGVEYVIDMIFSTAQKVLLLGVILAAAADFILTDKEKNEE